MIQEDRSKRLEFRLDGLNEVMLKYSHLATPGLGSMDFRNWTHDPELITRIKHSKF